MVFNLILKPCFGCTLTFSRWRTSASEITLEVSTAVSRQLTVMIVETRLRNYTFMLKSLKQSDSVPYYMIHTLNNGNSLSQIL